MAQSVQSILLLGGAPEDVTVLREHSFDVEHIDSLAAGLKRLVERQFDIVLLDLLVAPKPGIAVFAKVHAVAPHVPVVVLTTPEYESVALESLRLGAQDYLLASEPNRLLLISAIRKAMERHRTLETSRRDQHLLEILMNTIPDSIYFKDAESRFLRINRAQAKRFNLAKPGLAIGKTDADFFSEAHAKQARVDEQHVMQTGVPLAALEEMETWPDGTISWVSTTKVPLRDPVGRIVGTFGMSRDVTARKQAELALAERTRQLQQQNQQMEEELKMARELQLAMLPHDFPSVRSNGTPDSALEFFSFFFPSGSVSGDFFDVIELSDHAVGMFICDVMGHDVRAALVTAMMRSLVEDLSQTISDPGQLLAQINKGLAGVFKQTGTTMFATALYLVADVATGEMRYASAAHPDALHLHRAKGTVDALGAQGEAKGPALGLFEEARFPTHRRPLVSGDLIMLFTDGLVEAQGPNEECFSHERLASTLHRNVQLPAEEMFNHVISEVLRFCNNGKFSDDVALIGMEVKKVANGH